MIKRGSNDVRVFRIRLERLAYSLQFEPRHRDVQTLNTDDDAGFNYDDEANIYLSLDRSGYHSWTTEEGR